MRGFRKIASTFLPVLVVVFVVGGCGPQEDGVVYQGAVVLDEVGGFAQAEHVSIEARPGFLREPVKFTFSNIDLPGPLPEGLVPVAAADITVDDERNIIEPVTVTMDYDDINVPDEERLLVLHWDERRGYEAVTVMGHDMEANNITFQTRVFSPYIIVYWSLFPPDKFDVGFDPTVHGWAINNFGNFFAGGHCLGMAAYCSWYFDEGHDYLHDKYDNEMAYLVIVRAHQAQSQSQCFDQYDDMQSLGEKRIGWMMKAYLYYLKDPFITRLGRTGGGHAVVTHSYDTEKFYIYDVNYKETTREIQFKDGKFGKYGNYDKFGFVAFPTWGRTEDFGDITAEAESDFKTSTHLVSNSPKEGDKIREASVEIQGNLSGINKQASIYYKMKSGSWTHLKQGLGAFQITWPLDMGENKITMIAGVQVTPGTQSDSITNAATRILEVERVPTTETECDDGVDNDADDKTDCDDEDCESEPVCNQPNEICDDETDNDNDGLTDCEDTEDCVTHPSCNVVECEGVTEISCGQTVTGTTSGESNIDVYTGCSSWEETGPEKIYILRDAPPGHVSAKVKAITEGQDFDVFALENNCTPNACKEAGNSEAWFGVDPGKVYYIAVDGYEGNSGEFELSVSCE